jgi:serine protease AprX
MTAVGLTEPGLERLAELGLNGEGEIVGVADSGLDSGDPATIHPDFAGRLAALYTWPVSSDWSSIVTNVLDDNGPADTRSGHGTLMAGLVCGDGSASVAAGEDPVRGLAYKAHLVFQAIEQGLKWTDNYRQSYYRQYKRYPPDSGLAGLPADLTELFQRAYDAGVRIQFNGWGGGDFGAYDDYASAVDRFMWEHKDFLILFPAGNDGTDNNHDGIVDEGSITPPGTAKNCITVGAAESVRMQGGYQTTWGQQWPNNYPADPLRSDKVSDDPNDLAPFSSRGPTRDGRTKPDLVAPGTNILSTRSQALRSDTSPGWGAWPKANNMYMFDGGTTCSAALAAGEAAVVRQYLRTVQHISNPSAALLKAALIHGAQYRPYRFGGAPSPRGFDMAQGWDHLNLASILMPDPNVSVTWHDHVEGLVTGQAVSLSLIVADSSIPLVATLVWTDPPGPAGSYPNLINDMDLAVTDPKGEVFYGNAGDRADEPDRVNNVERVIIARPMTGQYQVEVKAFKVTRGPQDFALVYSGGCGARG